MKSALTQRLAKPAYLYRPEQLWHRARVYGQAEPVVTLPWRLRLAVTPSESIGGGIARRAVHELPVTETLFRLLAPKDLAVDVGANIGYFTSLMAYRVGLHGFVLAFEPHPALAGALRRNVARWSGVQVAVDERAVSNESGTAHLVIRHDFAKNMGTSSLEGEGAHRLAVHTVQLDEVLGEQAVALIKLDVEGHELAVLEGAKALLADQRINHVIFEEHNTLPTPVSVLLERAGYTVFALRERFRGVEVAAPEDPCARPRWDAPTYLATAVPDIVRARLRPDGWRSLRPHSGKF